MKNNLARVRVTIKGSRPLLQCAFTEAAIPLEAEEGSGRAGNDPTEWRKTCMVTPGGELYIGSANVFACIRDAAKYTKKGRGSIQALVAATLQVEEAIIPLNRRMPEGDPPRDPTCKAPVFIHVCGVKNLNTKSRNIRYRLAAGPGWACSFTILWDRTIVSREQMKAVLRDAGKLVGIADGRSVGNGRFKVTGFEELPVEDDDAEEEAAEGDLGGSAADRVAEGPETVLKVRHPIEVDGVPH